MTAVAVPTPKRRGIALGQTALAIPPHPEETVPIGQGFEASVNGLTIAGRPKFEAWAETGRRLRVMEKGAQFAIGDFLIYGEDRFGEKASQVIDPTEGWSERTCAVYRWLASRIAKADRRMDRLTIAHHLIVAALSPAKQRQWLTAAAAEDADQPWTVARMKRAIQEGGDAPETAFWVLVLCESETDQETLMRQMETSGRTTKAVVRRGRKATAPES